MAPNPIDDHAASFEVLYERPECILVEAHGLLIAICLTALKTEWLDGISAAFRSAYIRGGGKSLHLLNIMRLDRRFPLDLGFDANHAELRDTLQALRPSLESLAIVVEFDGLIGTMVHRLLQIVGVFSSRKPDVSVHRYVPSALAWLSPHLPTEFATVHARALQLSTIRLVSDRIGSNPTS